MLDLVKISENFLSKGEILVWIKPIILTENETEIFLHHHNSYFSQKFSEPKFLDLLKELERISGKKVLLKKTEINKISTAQNHQKQENQQIKKNDFIKTKENSLALKAFDALFNDGQTDLNPIFIYGESGTGKTTLGKKFLEFSQKSKFIISEDFVNDFFHEISTGENKLKNLLEFDVLVIDNIEYFEKRIGAQLKLATILDKFLNFGGKVLFISSKAKDDLKLDLRLKSRILSGLTLQIKPPSKDTIQTFLKNSGLEDFSNKTFSGIRELKSFCTTQKFLSQNDEAPKLSPEDFVENFLKRKNLSLSALKQRVNVKIKDKLIFDLKNMGVSFVRISNILGLANHTSAMYSYRKFNIQNID